MPEADMCRSTIPCHSQLPLRGRGPFHVQASCLSPKNDITQMSQQGSPGFILRPCSLPRSQPQAQHPIEGKGVERLFRHLAAVHSAEFVHLGGFRLWPKVTFAVPPSGFTPGFEVRSSMFTAVLCASWGGLKPSRSQHRCDVSAGLRGHD